MAMYGATTKRKRGQSRTSLPRSSWTTTKKVIAVIPAPSAAATPRHPR
jgi:hypothetical protein